jgi:hypothetical protein
LNLRWLWWLWWWRRWRASPTPPPPPLFSAVVNLTVTAAAFAVAAFAAVACPRSAATALRVLQPLERHGHRLRGAAAGPPAPPDGCRHLGRARRAADAPIHLRLRLLTRRARNTLGTATQRTRRNDSPPPPPPPPPPWPARRLAQRQLWAPRRSPPLRPHPAARRTWVRRTTPAKAGSSCHHRWWERLTTQRGVAALAIADPIASHNLP